MSGEPVGYACKKCGRMLVWNATERLWTNIECWCGSPRGRGYDVGMTAWYPDLPMPSWVQPGPPPGPWQDTHEWTGEFRVPADGEWYAGYPGHAGVRVFAFCRGSGGGHPSVTIQDGKRHILRPKAKAEPVVCSCCGKTIGIDDEKWVDDGLGGFRCGGCHMAKTSGEAARKETKMGVIAFNCKWQPRCPKCEWSMGNVPRSCKDGRLRCKCRRCGHKFFVPGVPPDNYCKAPQPKRPSRILAVARYYATHPLMLAAHYGAAAVASAALGYPQPIHWARDAIAWVASRAAEALV